MSNANNGLITKIWGPSLWVSLHCISFGYPIEPTSEQKQYYREFFIRLGDVLPCRYCRDSYKQFVSTGVTRLTDEVFENRESLTRWLYLLHEQVNKKLGITYGVTYDHVVKRYESYRASCGPKKAKGCLMPLDEKAKSYRIVELRDAPLIPLETAKAFQSYAKSRGLGPDEFKVLDYCNDVGCIHAHINDVDCNQWCQRNDECWDIIGTMRKNGIASVERDGQFKGLPTVEETKLLMRLSTTLDMDTLTEILDKLPQNTTSPNKKKVYKLKK